MTVFLLSMAGIPPTAGFIAKVGVFAAAIDAGNWSLVAIGLAARVAAAFFYLRVIVFMYMKEPAAAAITAMTTITTTTEGAIASGAAAATLAAVTLVLGVFPGLVSGII